MPAMSHSELMRSRSVFAMGLDPFSWYKQMRETDPVHIEEQYHMVEVFRYRDIQSILSTPTLFSSQRSVTNESTTRGSIVVVDPPRHNKLRGLVAQAFTPRMIEQQAARIRAIVNDLLDASAQTGAFDLITDLAYPLPMAVIIGMLGVPALDQSSIKRWSFDSMGISVEASARGFAALEHYFQDLLPKKRQHLQADLISHLLTVTINGEPLTEQEIVDFCVTLIIAGNETTTNLIGNTLLCFDAWPEAKEQVWANPDLIASALEESLRFLSPIQRMGRMVKQDTELGSKQLHAGQSLFLWIGSANRDEVTFANPDDFDCRRTPNRHMAFGSGIHFCIGAPLARLEAKIAYEVLIERFSDIQRVDHTALEPAKAYAGYGVEHLPVRMQRRSLIV